MLQIEDLSFFYPSTQKEMRFSLELENKDSFAIIGNNGAGKSSLINMIAGFLKPTTGKLYFNKNDISLLKPHARPVTVLFQRHNLFEHLNVFNNIAIGISPNLELSDKDVEMIDSILRAFKLYNEQELLPTHLSVGQQQLVAIARILLRNKEILLMDEPFAAIDPNMKFEILRLIKYILQLRKNIVLLMVTHCYEDILYLCNKVVSLDDGKIKDILPVNRLLRKY